MGRNTRHKAFTLVELLVVIAIVGVLVALLLPAVQAARESARRSQCTNNLKQMGLALQNFHSAKRSFPSGYVATPAYVDGGTDTSPGFGWAVQILPYMEDDTVYKLFNLKLPLEDATHATAIQTKMPVFICPSDVTPELPFAVQNSSGSTVATAAAMSYAACVGGDESGVEDSKGLGVFYRNSHTRIAEILDGTSKTVALGERAWGNAKGIWAGAINNSLCVRGPLNTCPTTGALTYPAAALVLAHTHLNNATTDGDGGLDDFSSPHAGGSNFVLADGSVHFIVSVTNDDSAGNFTPDSIVFQALGTKAGGEMIPDGWIQ